MKNTEQKSESSSAILVIAGLILLASLMLFYLNPLSFKDLYKVLILLAGVALSGLVFFASAQGHRLILFLQETKIELRKVIWPTKDETIKTTIMILIAVVIVAIFLWIVDSLFSWLVQLLTQGL